MLIQAIKIIALITIPVTFYSLVCGKDLICLIYKSRNFTDESVNMTLSVFRFHIAGLFFIAVNRIISPAFYAQGNTKLPTLAGIISFAVNIILASCLAFPFKGKGIALALTIASAVNTIFLLIFMNKMEGMQVKTIAKQMSFFILRMICFSIIAACPTYFLREFLIRNIPYLNRFVYYGLIVIICAICFALIGILLLIIFKDETAIAIINKLKKRKNKS